MSKATKRKHVTKEVLDEFVLPDEKKEIVRVIGHLDLYHYFSISDNSKFDNFYRCIVYTVIIILF